MVRETPFFAIFAYYLHDLDPFVIQFSETFGLRWYGLAYVVGFVFGYYLLKYFSRKEMLQVKPGELPDFMTFMALFGVFLGGRLGYFLLYQRDTLFNDPLSFFVVWNGGMASHGAIFGIAVFLWVYAKRKNYSWTNLGDHVVVVAPIGVALGRLANFINGELIGVKTTVAWAVKFPAELQHRDSYVVPEGAAPMSTAFQSDLPHNSYEIYERAEAMNLLPELAAALNPRHPSQLYQAMLEGVLLFLILLTIRLVFKKLPNGLLTGVFFLGYAGLRIIGEIFREPDVGAARILGFSKGQFYSLFMVAAGLAFLLFALTRSRSKSS